MRFKLDESIPVRIDSNKNIDAIFWQFIDRIKKSGFDYISYGAIIQTIDGPRQVMLNNYPASWIDHYIDQGYKFCDPALAHSFVSTAHALWTPEMFSVNIKAKTLYSEIIDIGLRSGITFPVRDSFGSVASINFISSEAHPKSFWTDAVIGRLYISPLSNFTTM